jgi:serine/threonine protein kinase
MKAASQWEDLVYEAALKVKDPDERKTFLDQACAGDAELRAAVEEMLSTQAEAERFFAGGASALKISAEALQWGNGGPALAGDSRIKLPEDERIGAHIGHYKLLQKIGEGGCGIVYLADQEEPVRRTVALKIIKLGMDTKNLIARFGAERQALALMDHPNIARALDAGATDTGRPYFVMELVRGERITDYCDLQNLDIRRRLDLFIQICHAVQHAHQKGIIHRDIKPSNILVTSHDGAPMPKVIDFGVAKAITGERLADNTIFTACEQFIGTPAYMSPEQAQMDGMDIDTRSDIYSLGVLLYELLTGHTPFDGKELVKSGMEELQRTLREKEPPRPSAMLAALPPEDLAAVAQRRGIEPDRLIGQARGDLDWIIMKALEKDRARRYETAHEVALDIQRYLNGEAVLACPPGRMYLLQKLVRRNQAVFAGAAAVLATLCLGLSLSTVFYFQERAARQEAEREKKAERVLLANDEAMQKIALAALELDAGKVPEAAALVQQIPPGSSLSPSLQTAQVYRDIGAWYAIHEQWKDAAVFFRGLQQVNQYSRNLNSHPAIWDLLEAGASLVESGDPQGSASYEEIRKQAILRLGSFRDPLLAERLLRGSLVLPADAETLQSLQPPAQAVLKSLSGPGPDTNSSREAPWRWVSLALFEYRQGHWAEAAQRCQSLPSTDTNLARIATVHVILAVCQQRLGKAGEALAELKQGRELVEAKFRAGLTPGGLADGYWFDWVTARILLREALGWIKSAPQAVNSPAHFPEANPPLFPIPGVPSLFDERPEAQTFMADFAGWRRVS